MTLSLYLLRHGKSDWGSDYASDRERPLKSRGRRAAARVGRFLTDEGQEPDLVLASPAVRARDTARLAHEAGTWSAPLELREELYDSTPGRVLDEVHAVADTVGRLLVVGHEPTSSALVGLLTGSPPPVMPTAALARIDFEVDAWSGVEPGRGRLAFLVTPRELEDALEEG